MDRDIIGVAGVDDRGFYIVKPMEWVTETGERFVKPTKVYTDSKKIS